MRSDVAVRDPPSSDFHDYKDIEQSKIGCDDHEEVASQNDLSMVPNKDHPTLQSAASARSPIVRHVPSDSPRRDSDAKFQQQLSGDALLSPGRIAAGC
jgi:hypothetical protein